jgi:hypothetical protein
MLNSLVNNNRNHRLRTVPAFSQPLLEDENAGKRLHPIHLRFYPLCLHASAQDGVDAL